ncbi:hypothetical protein LINGRAHAP2_LOCUS3811 [Linum grandiflorum]
MSYASSTRFSPNVRSIFRQCVKLFQKLDKQDVEWSSLNMKVVCTLSDATICSMFVASPRKDPGALMGTCCSHMSCRMEITKPGSSASGDLLGAGAQAITLILL